MSNPYQTYRAAAATTASPVELVVMLNQGALRFTQQGIQAVERGDASGAHTSFVRAQEIVAELAGSLNLDAGGEVGQNLLALYDYAYCRLVEANCRKATGPAMDVAALFRELLSAWRAVAGGTKTELPSSAVAVPA